MKGVFKKISQVTAALRVEGIGKDRKVSAGAGGSYAFRGIDDVYCHLSRALVSAGLVIIPKVISNDLSIIERDGGKVSRHVVLHVEFTLIDTDDGSEFTGSGYGEALDTSDKAFGKAASYAYKSFCFQAFCIPTEGDNDTENSNHAAGVPKPKEKQKITDERFIKALGAISGGSFTVLQLRTQFELSAEQEEQLRHTLGA